MRASCAAIAIVAAFASASQALAAPADVAAHADAAFQEAKALRAAGKIAEACAKFEESRRLANGVGVTLHLADCYAQAGRPASAWATFVAGESLAHERSDKREAIAHARAIALEPTMPRVVFDVAPAAQALGVAVRVDGGGAVPPGYWKIGVALDPGPHRVAYAFPGRAPHDLNVTIEAPSASIAASTVVHIEAEPAPAPPPPRPAAPVSAAVLSSAPITTSVDPARSRTSMELGLLGAAAVGFGAGAAFLAMKNGSATLGPDGIVTYDHGVSAASTIAFSAGAAALVSAVVLYLTAPAPKDGAAALARPPFPITF